MLIKVTNKCSMGCSHCMENSTPKGEHMPLDLFEKALLFTKRTEDHAYRMGAPPLILLSGGECSEHPEFVTMLNMVASRGWIPLMITNGIWIQDEKLRSQILDPARNVIVQVTNDARYYPTSPPAFEDRRVSRVDSLSALLPLGRAVQRDGKTKLSLVESGLRTRTSPSSFNFRSLARSFQSFSKAVCHLRLRAAGGMSGHCSPSISADGTVVAGESNLCFAIGTVESSEEELTSNVLAMRECNRCGLEDRLGGAYRKAIGI